MQGIFITKVGMRFIVGLVYTSNFSLRVFVILITEAFLWVKCKINILGLTPPVVYDDSKYYCIV